MSGWIKCSERMPELPKGGGKARVIAYTPARKAQSAFNGARFLYWNGIDWRYGDGSRFEHRVTHWQPHLTPPTEQPTTWRRPCIPAFKLVATF
ncbi:hypothetical protein 9F7_70 [uncultured Caudovirales phage]|uniref:DUF551 domain-containing protein n=2 Tax=root TaxID=1 RepID=A0A2H4J1U4_9CAUD|nr:hypothetical protein 3S4_62 [uncultured Caudovirales phage]ASN68359.1 hypothetical protein 3F6_18 [uncultured Caudovirales phage]ASN68507.1 hypothetical protein 9F7_70 [uncultured Caudovirales phage]ASN68588.1 hypothetical protein 8S7_55 [uncultured Caudovirales phage]ASN72141.1 hypothetical protein 7F6_40 [uncultured Caudovirales phage]